MQWFDSVFPECRIPSPTLVMQTFLIIAALSCLKTRATFGEAYVEALTRGERP
jgi:hypothetical protein